MYVHVQKNKIKSAEIEGQVERQHSKILGEAMLGI